MKNLFYAFFLALGMVTHIQAQSPIMFTEFSYNPPELGTDTLEYVEIYNNSNATVDISGYKLILTNDLRYTYPSGFQLGPYGVSVLAVKATALQTVFNLSFTPIQWSTGPGLSNTSGHFVIRDSNNVTIDSVAYSKANLPTSTDGRGTSAVICDKSLDNNVMANWSASTNAILNQSGTAVSINNYNLYGSPGFIECGLPNLGPLNDDCGGAISLTVGTVCSSTIGSYENATESIPACTGNIANDVWYSFVATSTTMKVEVTNTTEDIIFELFSGSCTTLNPMYCVDMTYINTELVQANHFQVGETYYVRVYNFDGANSAASFEICVTNLPIVAAPVNDECLGATMLTPSLNCTPIAGTLNGATQSMPEGDCETYDGYAIDVWYSFVATNNIASVLVTGDMAFDAIVEAFSGSCGNLVPINCADNTYPSPSNPNNVTETLNLTNLVIGQTYYIRVYEIASAFLNLTDFNICLVGQPPVMPCDTINLSLTLDGCNGFNQVTSVSNGLPPYSYLWSTSDTTMSVTGLVIGETYSVTVTDAMGCSATSTFEQTICDAIDKIALGFDINLFPNPAINKATLALVTEQTIDLNIQLVNINGQILSSEVIFLEGNMAFDLNINDLPNGVYFVKISSKGGVITKQLIITK